MTADGETVYSLTHDYLESEKNQCGSVWADTLSYVRFGFNHSGSSFVLNFSSTLDSNSSDEAWGICNIQINTVASYVYSSGEEVGVIQDFTFSCSAPAKDNNWYYYPSYQTTNCTGGTYVGGYGAGDYIESVLYVPRSHVSLIVSFRVMFIGTWAGEYFNVTVNGNTAYSMAYDSAEGASGAISSTCGDSVGASYKTVQFGLNSTYSTIAIGFNSTLSDESSSDAAWGICALFIQPKETYVTPEGFPYGGSSPPTSMPAIKPSPKAFWNYIPHFRYIQCGSYYYSGPFGAGEFVSAQFQTMSHKSLYVEFDLLLLDSWENETFTLSVDGEVVYTKTHTQDPAGTNQCGTYWNDEILSVKVGVNHSSETVQLVFSSTLDSGIDDESWAFSGPTVEVWGGYISPGGEFQGWLKSPYFSCEGPVNDPDWSYTPSFATTTCSNRRYVGGYSSGGSMNSTYFFQGIHHGIIMSIEIALLGPWQNNSFIVAADDMEVFRFTYTYDESDSTSCDEETYAYIHNVTFGFNFSNWELHLKFFSDIDSDELSWGVCHVEIATTWGTVDSYGNELNAAALRTLSCEKPHEDLTWIYTPSYSTVKCSSVEHYVGDFGQGGSLKSTLRVADPHLGLVISFNLAIFDTWKDDSAIYVIAGNDVVYAMKPSDYNGTAVSACNDSYNYTSLEVTFGFNHSLNTLTLEIASNLNEDSLDQSWGICDLEIVPTTGYVTLDGTEISSS